MKLLHLFLPLLLISLLSSCVEPAKIQASEDIDLLAIDTLLNIQSKLLIGKNCQKIASIHGKQEQHDIIIDSAFFKNDLSIVHDDLSKVFGQLIYQKETSSDKKTVSYVRNDKDFNGPVSMKIEKDEQGSIVNIDIIEGKVNYLHHTELKISLTFEPSANLLKTYQIKGSQQVIGMDAIPFEVAGQIN